MPHPDRLQNPAGSQTPAREGFLPPVGISRAGIAAVVYQRHWRYVFSAWYYVAGLSTGRRQESSTENRVAVVHPVVDDTLLRWTVSVYMIWLGTAISVVFGDAGLPVLASTPSSFLPNFVALALNPSGGKAARLAIMHCTLLIERCLRALRLVNHIWVLLIYSATAYNIGLLCVVFGTSTAF